MTDKIMKMIADAVTSNRPEIEIARVCTNIVRGIVYIAHSLPIEDRDAFIRTVNAQIEDELALLDKSQKPITQFAA